MKDTDVREDAAAEPPTGSESEDERLRGES